MKKEVVEGGTDEIGEFLLTSQLSWNYVKEAVL